VSPGRQPPDHDSVLICPDPPFVDPTPAQFSAQCRGRVVILDDTTAALGPDGSPLLVNRSGGPVKLLRVTAVLRECTEPDTGSPLRIIVQLY
jgi:hypothetical protein